MIELMRSPEIHGVVTKEFSRLMRPENFDDYQLLQHFADTKTILYLPEGPIDLGSKMGRLMGGVRALFAGVEREEIRERVWGAKEAKRKCATTYMRRESLEPQLDLIFSERLTDPAFLRELVQEQERRMDNPVAAAVLARVETEISNLAAKRERILGAFFDGVIGGPERDTRLAGIEVDLKVNQGLLAQNSPVEPMATEALDSICTTFHDWEFLNMQDKRRILAATGADIRVANSSIHGVYINLPEPRHNEITHTDRDSWRRRA
jgi:hypothetical protein